MNRSTVEEIFKVFTQAESFRSTINAFKELCQKANLDPSHVDFLNRAKDALPLKEVQDLWNLLDKRRSHADFMKGKACKDAKVLIIGGGPCGLRMAIDTALLGAKVVLLEKRDYISRNNVLHIWPFVIHDLKSIGTKIFYPQFCVGSMDHISIRRLQLVLLKICLLVGVEVAAPVGFEGLIKPTSPEEGWRAKVSPPNHPVADFEFDAVIGADGKRNCLGFERKCFRAKQALAIAVNFVNRRTKEENAIQEIGGINFVMRRDFFNNIKNSTGVDLENFVYYKNDTHYFVMTAKKKSLLQKGVLKQDFSTSAELLHPSNIDHEILSEISYKLADVSTNGEIPNLELVVNHRGEDDVSIFDFTAMFQANYSCKAVKEHGKKLLMAIIGDTLIEPFWPTGTGAARGFLSAMDAAWLLRQWCRPDMDPLAAIAERENVYQLLSQTTPDSMNRKMNAYSINPTSRYGTKMKTDKMKIGNVRHLFNQEGERSQKPLASKFDLVQNTPLSQPLTPIASMSSVKRLGDIMKQASVAADGHRNLLGWYQNKLIPYGNLVHVEDMTESWRNGVALSIIFHLYRPNLLSIDYLMPENIEANNEIVFKLIEEEFGVSPRISAFDLASGRPIDALAILSYLSQFHDCLVEELPVKVSIKDDQDISPEEEAEIKRHRFKSHGRRRSSAAILKKMHSKEQYHTSFRHTRQQRKPEGAYERAQRELQSLRERREKVEREKSVKSQNSTGPRSFKSNASITFSQQSHTNKNERKSVQDLQSFYKNNDKSFKQSDSCCICEKRLYVVERRTAHGYFFHRNCFRCSECKVFLRLDNSLVHKDDKGKATFTCFKKTCASRHLQKLNESSPTDEENQEPESDTISELKTMQHPIDSSSNSDDSSSSNSETDSDSEVPEEDKMIYKLSRKHSVCLLLCDEIQEQFETVQNEEEKLEVRGLEAERKIRGEEQGDENVNKEEAMENFLEIITMQQQLENWQSELMLKIKLMELDEEKSKLEFGQKSFSSKKANAGNVEKIDVKDGVKNLAAQIKSLKSFLDDAADRLDKLQD